MNDKDLMHHMKHGWEPGAGSLPAVFGYSIDKPTRAFLAAIVAHNGASRLHHFHHLRNQCDRCIFSQRYVHRSSTAAKQAHVVDPSLCDRGRDALGVIETLCSFLRLKKSCHPLGKGFIAVPRGVEYRQARTERADIDTR